MTVFPMTVVIKKYFLKITRRTTPTCIKSMNYIEIFRTVTSRIVFNKTSYHSSNIIIKNSFNYWIQLICRFQHDRTSLQNLSIMRHLFCNERYYLLIIRCVNILLNILPTFNIFFTGNSFLNKTRSSSTFLDNIVLYFFKEIKNNTFVQKSLRSCA